MFLHYIYHHLFSFFLPLSHVFIPTRIAYPRRYSPPVVPSLSLISSPPCSISNTLYQFVTSYNKFSSLYFSSSPSQFLLLFSLNFSFQSGYITVSINYPPFIMFHFILLFMTIFLCFEFSILAEQIFDPNL